MEALHGTHALGETAELVAEKYGVTREAQDAFALESQRRWAARRTRPGASPTSSCPSTDAGQQERATPTDRSRSTSTRAPTRRRASWRRCAPAFRKQGGTVTAGNSSGINDGAAARAARVGERARALGCGRRPLARFVAVGGRRRRAAAAWASGRSRPRARRWQRAGIGVGELDLVELNEAFAAQAIAVHARAGAGPGDGERERRRHRASGTRSARRARAW